MSGILLLCLGEGLEEPSLVRLEENDEKGAAHQGRFNLSDQIVLFHDCRGLR